VRLAHLLVWHVSTRISAFRVWRTTIWLLKILAYRLALISITARPSLRVARNVSVDATNAWTKLDVWVVNLVFTTLRITVVWIAVTLQLDWQGCMLIWQLCHVPLAPLAAWIAYTKAHTAHNAKTVQYSTTTVAQPHVRLAITRTHPHTVWSVPTPVKLAQWIQQIVPLAVIAICSIIAVWRTVQWDISKITRA